MILGAHNPPNHELLDIETAGDFVYTPGGLRRLDISDVSSPATPVAIVTHKIAECNGGHTHAEPFMVPTQMDVEENAASEY
jgi:hypothetical protein